LKNLKLYQSETGDIPIIRSCKPREGIDFVEFYFARELGS